MFSTDEKKGREKSKGFQSLSIRHLSATSKPGIKKKSCECLGLLEEGARIKIVRGPSLGKPSPAAFSKRNGMAVRGGCTEKEWTKLKKRRTPRRGLCPLMADPGRKTGRKDLFQRMEEEGSQKEEEGGGQAGRLGRDP